MRRCVFASVLPFALSGCSVWFFSGENGVDRSHPVVLVETTGGVELGAATEFGVLTLGRTATTGPCRVHYFLGPTPVIEDGEMTATGSLFVRADIDLKTMAVRALDHDPGADQELFVMWTPDGTTTRSVPVRRAHDDAIDGDALLDPGVALPVGATVLHRHRESGLLFAGLVAGTAEVECNGGVRRYYVYAGVDRVRELLAVPQLHPRDQVPRYRTDDITVLKPAK
ncbi:MAG: hypothetical protein JNK78_04365 [Planctomycetes bacterium]|nr:hypothetical protein [Planctomycetota bacterium]